MNRFEWQNIAEEKQLAASVLLAAGQWNSAYYLAGYAIECGLKSCILARLARSPEVIFDEKMFSKNCWTHDIDELVELAGLEPERKAAVDADPVVAKNWMFVAEWSEIARYQGKSESEARGLYEAITDPVNGVMRWVAARW